MWSDLNVLTGLDCCDKKLAGYVRPALPLLPLLGGLVGLLACTSGYLVSAKSGWSLVKHISHLLTINKTLPGLSSSTVSPWVAQKRKSKYWEEQGVRAIWYHAPSCLMKCCVQLFMMIIMT